MKNNRFRKLVAVAISLTFIFSGNSSSAIAYTKDKIDTTIKSKSFSISDAINESAQDELFHEGNVYGNYKVEKVGRVESLHADTAILKNTISGTLLYLVRNDDQEKGFDISYKVPILDNTDIPHILEHSIICSSGKYQSHDLFYDIDNMTYNTYTNASTTNISTSYMLSSISQKQFIKLIDAYMSCMTDPEVLKNENFFKREAARYELYDKDEPISISGIVLSEDLSYLTDPYDKMINETAQALYTDTIYEYSIGRCYMDLDNMTFENLKKVYDDYYHFDNAMIYLYGDMDYKAILDFLDKNYLSRYPKRTNSVHNPEVTVPEGHIDKVIDIPAYKGTSATDKNQIWYAFDLSSFTPKEVYDLTITAGFLNINTSPLARKLHDAGIYNDYSCTLNIDRAAYPILIFTLSDTSADIKKETFKDIVDEVVGDMAKHGIDDDLFRSTAYTLKKENAFNSLLTTQIDNHSITASCFWVQSGSPDYLNQFENSQAEILEDKNQKIIKKMSSKLLKVDRTSLIEGRPKPGLAEKIEDGIEDYLDSMKRQMSPEEIQQMIADTEAFNAWNEIVEYNHDLSISIQDLPEVKPFDKVKTETLAGIHLASVEIPEDYDIYSTGICFDVSSVSQDELYDLAFFTDMLGALDTESHSKEELNSRLGMVGDISFELSYNEYMDPFNRPYFTVSMSGLGEDYADTLHLMDEILTTSKFEKNRILENIDLLISNYDPLTVSSADISEGIVLDCTGLDTGYVDYLSGEGYYRYLKELKRKLQNSPSYMTELSGRMSDIQKKIYQKGNMCMDIVASPKNKTDIKRETRKFITKLPEGTKEDHRKDYDFSVPEEHSLGYVVDDSLTSTIFSYAFEDELNGKCLPFISALENEYFLPETRFKNGVYGTGLNCSIGEDSITFFTTQDSNPSVTLDIIKNSPTAMRQLDIDKQTLEDYMISVHKRFTAPNSILQKAALSLGCYYSDVPYDYYVTATNELKSATLKDQEDAAKLLEKATTDGFFVAAGNDKILKQNKDIFEKVIRYN